MEALAYKLPIIYLEMEKTLSEKERAKISAMIEKHRPKAHSEKEKGKETEMAVTSEKGTKIVVKTEAATCTSTTKKYEVEGTDVETELDIDTETEEQQISELKGEDRQMFEEFKEFYTIQG